MKYIIIVFLGATILMSCTEEILVEREKIVYDTVYLKEVRELFGVK